MSFNDATSDMIATIRNGQQSRIAEVSAVSNRLNKNVLKVLKDEGFINDFSEREVRKGIKKLDISLKYFNGQPVIQQIKRVSKPGRRRYSQIDSLKKNFNGLGITIVSTSKGVLPDYEARKHNVGGEVICEVF
jgi:small subunit ribosomal protein S8